MERTVREIRRGDAAAILGRREDPNRAGGPSWEGQHCLAAPQRRHRPEHVLRLFEGVPGGRQEAIDRYATGGLEGLQDRKSQLVSIADGELTFWTILDSR